MIIIASSLVKETRDLIDTSKAYTNRESKKNKYSHCKLYNYNRQCLCLDAINLYTMNVDWERNCYNCREFGHIIKNYKSQRTVLLY